MYFDLGTTRTQREVAHDILLALRPSGSAIYSK